MKVFACVLFVVAAANAEAEAKAKSDSDADAYTFGQIHHGLPVHNAYATGHPHNVGVITGVDYGHGHVSGYGAIGNRGYAGYGHHGYAHFGNHGFYGKREADSDAKSDAYTFGQIHAGLPVHNAYATGHPHNVGLITGVDYGYGQVSGYGAIGNRGYAGYGHHGYAHHGTHGYYGKREADSDAKSDAYTFGQIHAGLPVHNAYATGHPHNVGVITGVDYGYGRVSGYGAIGNRGYAGYGHHGYAHHGTHGYYGKREADSDAKSDAYTFGQIHAGLPVHNAYATGHPHNVGVITGVDYGHGHVSGYGAIGNRGYAGYGHGYAGIGHFYG